MKKFPIIVGAITLILLIAGVFVFSKKSEPITPPVGGYEYYWGDGCPHCKVVAEFLDSWEDKDKVTLTKFETWNDANNAKKLSKVFDYCKTPANQRGVPVLFTPDGKCLIGDTPIIEKLKEAASSSTQTK
jgi:glutaredoxin